MHFTDMYLLDNTMTRNSSLVQRIWGTENTRILIATQTNSAFKPELRNLSETLGIRKMELRVAQNYLILNFDEKLSFHFLNSNLELLLSRTFLYKI